MTPDEFWTLIDDTRGPAMIQAHRLTARLVALGKEDILAFEGQRTYFVAQLSTIDHYVASFLLQGRASAEAFLNYRAWLIMQGRERYSKALAQAATLTEWLDDMDMDALDASQYGAITLDAYLSVGGSAMGFDAQLPCHAEAGFAQNIAWPDVKEKIKTNWPELYRKYWNVQRINKHYCMHTDRSERSGGEAFDLLNYCFTTIGNLVTTLNRNGSVVWSEKVGDITFLIFYSKLTGMGFADFIAYQESSSGVRCVMHQKLLTPEIVKTDDATILTVDRKSCKSVTIYPLGTSSTEKQDGMLLVIDPSLRKLVIAALEKPYKRIGEIIDSIDSATAVYRMEQVSGITFLFYQSTVKEVGYADLLVFTECNSVTHLLVHQKLLLPKLEKDTTSITVTEQRHLDEGSRHAALDIRYPIKITYLSPECADQHKTYGFYNSYTNEEVVICDHDFEAALDRQACPSTGWEGFLLQYHTEMSDATPRQNASWYLEDPTALSAYLHAACGVVDAANFSAKNCAALAQFLEDSALKQQPVSMGIFGSMLTRFLHF